MKPEIKISMDLLAKMVELVEEVGGIDTTKKLLETAKLLREVKPKKPIPPVPVTTSALDEESEVYEK